MSFTYSESLVSDRDKVRFAVGDTVFEEGPRPEDANFTDEELDGLLVIEGTWERAVAAAFETLVALWTKHVTFNAEGISASMSDIADRYRQSAAEWRQRFGDPPASMTSQFGSESPTRTDGYSADIASDVTDYVVAIEDL